MNFRMIDIAGIASDEVVAFGAGGSGGATGRGKKARRGGAKKARGAKARRGGAKKAAPKRRKATPAKKKKAVRGRRG